MFDLVLDSLSLICLIVAGGFSIAAGIGLLRFPDVLSRLHAATKPQIFGLLLTIAAIALHDRAWMTLLALVPVFVFQCLTAPIAAHMVARAAYRTGQIDEQSMVIDELAPAVEQSDRTK